MTPDFAQTARELASYYEPHEELILDALRAAYQAGLREAYEDAARIVRGTSRRSSYHERFFLLKAAAIKNEKGV